MSISAPTKLKNSLPPEGLLFFVSLQSPQDHTAEVDLMTYEDVTPELFSNFGPTGTFNKQIE